MSTAVYFFAVNEVNRQTTQRWTECCSAAVFNRTGKHPGHGDQGVLNAILYAEDRSARVELLENSLWSQHWVYWKSIIDFADGKLLNRTSASRLQRSFHCGGAEKFWFPEHRDRVLNGNALQVYPYVWFLAMLWFGKCRSWGKDPYQWLTPRSHHLVQDLVNFLPQILQVLPRSREMWNDVSDPMINRAANGVPRAMSLGGGSMSEVFRLVAQNPQIRRYVEVGGYEGGSLLALALRFANRDIDFYCVESFMGNLNGTMDGHRLPVRQKFLENLMKYPALRARLIPGQSVHAARLFDDQSVDCVFIDACHETPAVIADLDAWIPKITPGGILAGDDFRWESVRCAVHQRLGEVQATQSGDVWWTRVK
jgi:predicted O-methyltransferase YrrM